MNYSLKEFYNELYRIFSCTDSLLTQSQTVLLGDCMRSLIIGENVTYKLENLYRSVEKIPKIAEPLDNFIHQYIKFVEENEIEEDKPTEMEDTENGHEETYSSKF